LTSEDKFVILASDGLWDNVKRKDTASIIEEGLKVKNSDSDSEKIMYSLYNRGVEQICYK